MASNNLGVAGTDGIVPIYDPNRRWTIWSRDEIFEGGIGQGKYIPNLKDYVVEPDTYTTYIVEFLDQVTLLPTLREIKPASLDFSFSQSDVLFGVGPGTQADTYRIYIDNSVTPHILSVDTRLKIAGSLSNYAKIFKGTDTSTQGIVISKVYDNNNNFISENIPLELVAIDSHINYSIKIISVAHTDIDMLDGELVTAVIYNDQGNVVSKRQLLVENTAFIRDINTAQKFITQISLDSAFISPSIDNTLEFPLNIPVNALNMIGVVQYSDGTTLRLPVDGTKFSIYGLDQYISSIVGQKVDLVLNYSLSTNETAVGAISNDGNHITENYSLVTTNPNNSYAVKLFGYPIWINNNIGYEIKWFLLNLDRNVWYDVTSNVTFSSNTGPFNPLLYGFVQNKTVQVNLAEVNGTFDVFIHVQNVSIVLNHAPQPDISQIPWTISNEVTANALPYGDGIYAKKISPTSVNISAGITTSQEWLDKTYLRSKPLVDPRIETAPLDPTHFILMVRGVETEFPISEWNQDLTISADLNQFESVYVRFIKKVGLAQLELSVVGMISK